MADEKQWTIGELLTWTTGFLKDHRVDSPRLDAEILLAHARGCQRIELYTSYAEDAHDELRGRFRELVRQRAAGTPVAYLVGYKEFYSLPFEVTPDVLIPRPETELLVVALLDEVNRRPGDGSVGPVFQVADVGTGSGILAVCAARLLTQNAAVANRGVAVTAIDTSCAALEVARRNAGRHGVSEAITFLESDLLAGVPDDARFDFIISNPPYVAESELESLSPDVRLHEPRQALVAGPRGTEVIEQLVPQAAERLMAGGMLLFETSPMIAEACRELIASHPLLKAEDIMHDLAGNARVIRARRRDG